MFVQTTLSVTQCNKTFYFYFLLIIANAIEVFYERL